MVALIHPVGCNDWRLFGSFLVVGGLLFASLAKMASCSLFYCFVFIIASIAIFSGRVVFVWSTWTEKQAPYFEYILSVNSSIVDRDLVSLTHSFTRSLHIYTFMFILAIQHGSRQ
jgi:hypothetical protein